MWASIKYIWDKVFKSGLSKFCRRQSSKNLHSPLSNTLSYLLHVYMSEILNINRVISIPEWLLLGEREDDDSKLVEDFLRSCLGPLCRLLFGWIWEWVIYMGGGWYEWDGGYVWEMGIWIGYQIWVGAGVADMDVVANMAFFEMGVRLKGRIRFRNEGGGAIIPFTNYVLNTNSSPYQYYLWWL